MVVSKADIIDYILSKMFAVCPYIDTAVVCDRDGFLMGNMSKVPFEAETVGAISSSVFHNADRVISELQDGKLEDMIIIGENGYVLVIGVEDFAILAVSSANRRKLIESYEPAYKAALSISLLKKVV
ncbi:MAG: roadblock/LC7 domain-containing protein [Deltaproteobacteria bacterium]|nr:roadblock/LC7 domain-containing protein [Deltaproteobacteria bacterium]